MRGGACARGVPVERTACLPRLQKMSDADLIRFGKAAWHTVEKRIRILRQFAACFTDYRNPDLIEHPVEELVAQRVFGLALGYEDLNDHEELRNDPLLAVLVEKSDPRQETLAGKSTLNRLELTRETASRRERYKKIVLDHAAVDRLLV